VFSDKFINTLGEVFSEFIVGQIDSFLRKVVWYGYMPQCSYWNFYWNWQKVV